ncbi:MAG: YihY/virulence factor BrkB family protein [Miltoncostaeaceae bacterium]
MHLWRIKMLVERAVRGFIAAGGTRAAAAIAYYALLSFVPLVLALAGMTGLILGGDRLDDLIDRAVEALPLTSEGFADIAEILRGAGEGSGAVGLAGIVGLIWTASGVMGAIRTGMTTVMGAGRKRPFITGKLIDLLLVLLAGVVLLGAAAVTVVLRVADDELLARLGIPGSSDLVGILIPVVVGFLVLLGLLRFVPAVRIPWSAAWRAALGGGVGLWALTNAFGFYVANFGNYNAVYGSLGAVIAFLAFIYLVAIVVLLTAAVAAVLPGVRAAESKPPDNPYAVPMATKVRTLLRGLVTRR